MDENKEDGCHVRMAAEIVKLSRNPEQDKQVSYV